MRRVTRNFLVDVVAFVLFVLLATTGVMMRFTLPPGSGRHVGVFGLDRHGWGDIHFWIALSLASVLTLHLVLHWQWIVCAVRGRPSEASGGRALLGMVGLLAAIGLVASPLFAPVGTIDVPAGEGRHGGWEEGRSGALEEGRPAYGRETSGERTLGEGSSGEERPAGNDIRGSLTLADLEAQTGVPAAYVLAKLGAPVDTPHTETLGRLRRRYGFAMGDVRKIVEEYPGAK